MHSNGLLDLLGTDAVLLPIPRGRKKPVIKRWQFTSADQMREPEYLAKLNHKCNIGVPLGRGLITIDSDQDTAVEPFLNLNPKLRKTLRTRRVRGCNFWVRIKGDYPKSCKLKTRSGEDWGEWRADGNQTVIYGEAIDRKKGETQANRLQNRQSRSSLSNWPLMRSDGLMNWCLPW